METSETRHRPQQGWNMRTLNGKRILVTGGAGFIGSHFVEHLLDTYPDVRVITLDKLTYAGSLDNLRAVMDDPRHVFIHGDVTRREDLEKAVQGGVDWIFHFAAETHVDRSLYTPERFLHTDIWGTFTVLEVARAIGVEGMVHISTDEVYGSIPEGQTAHEYAPFLPSSPYAASKAAADLLVHAYGMTYDLPVLIVRPSNTYGPRQYPEKLIPLFILRAMENRPLPLYGDGLYVRDWLYVTDLCTAIRLIAERGVWHTPYNVAAGDWRTNLDVARTIVDMLGKSADLIHRVQDRPGHDRRYAMDAARVRQLGWRPKVPFPEGIRRTIEWWRAHADRWQKIRSDPEYHRFFARHYGSRLDAVS